MQARVEGAFGYVKQHSRVSMLAANVPTRWWPQATTDFINKKKTPLVLSMKSSVISDMLKLPLHIFTKIISYVSPCPKNLVRRKFSRRIDFRRYFVRGMVVPFRTHLMAVDASTKRLPSPAHIKHRDIMLGHVPFSFAARTLCSSVGGGMTLPLAFSASLPDRGSLFLYCGKRGNFSCGDL